MDGVPGLTQQAVPPGGTFVYEFTATNVGTRWYHSHQDAEVQVPLGLFGPVIVEPKAPEPVRYDREYTFTLSEWDLDLTPAVATGDASLPAPRSDVPLSKQLDYDLFLVNGKATEALPPIAVASGQRVRLRLINAGNLIHTVRGRAPHQGGGDGRQPGAAGGRPAGRRRRRSAPRSGWTWSCSAATPAGGRSRPTSSTRWPAG